MLTPAGSRRRLEQAARSRVEGDVQPNPAARVSAPAIALIVTGGLSAATTLFLMLLIAVGGLASIGDPEIRDALPGIGVLAGVGVFKLLIDLLTIYAGLEMRKLQHWTVCLAGSIGAMLPCTFCCILGLPMGIWALIVLLDDDVKRVFDGGGPPPGGYGPPPGGYGPPPGGSGPPPGGYGPPPGDSGPPSGGSVPPPGGYGPPPGAPQQPPQP